MAMVGLVTPSTRMLGGRDIFVVGLSGGGVAADLLELADVGARGEARVPAPRTTITLIAGSASSSPKTSGIRRYMSSEIALWLSGLLRTTVAMPGLGVALDAGFRRSSVSPPGARGGRRRGCRRRTSVSISSRSTPSSERTDAVCWPSHGAGERTLNSRSENRVGGAMVFIGPMIGCSRSTTMPARLDVRIGERLFVGEHRPARHPGGVEPVDPGAGGQVVVMASISASSSSICAIRATRSTKRGSSAQSGRLRTSLMRRSQSRSVLAPMVT